MSDTPEPQFTETIALSDVLRPRSVGDILDATVRLYRRHFLLYFGIVILVQAVIFIVSQSFQIPYNILMRRFSGGETAGGVNTDEELMSMLMLGVPAVVGFMLFMLVAIVGYQFYTGGLVIAVSETFLGRPITIGKAYRAVWERFFSLLGAGLLSGLLQFTMLSVGLVVMVVAIGIGGAVGGTAMTVLGVVAGLGALTLALLGTLYVFLSFLLAPQVVMLEDAPAVGALRRSWELMRVRSERGMFRSNVFRAGIILLIVFAINMAAALVVQIPVFIIVAVIAFRGGEIGATPGFLLPLWLQIPAQLFQTIVSSLFVPLGSIAMLLFYYDIRIRFEGFDLQVRASEIAAR